MSIEFSLAADGIGAEYTSSGVLTGQDLLDADERLREAVRCNSRIRYLLVDHSRVSEEEVDSASIRALARRTGETLELIPDGIVAIVAPNDVVFGLSRMWEIQAEQPGLLTFVARTREEAIAWLRRQLTRRQLPFRLSE